MALVYKHQARIEALARKVTGTATPLRMSDMEITLFSDPGSLQKRKSDELVYYNGKNADAATVNRKITDAQTTFMGANGGSGSGRADETEHVFYQNGNFT